MKTYACLFVMLLSAVGFSCSDDDMDEKEFNTMVSGNFYQPTDECLLVREDGKLIEDPGNAIDGGRAAGLNCMWFENGKMLVLLNHSLSDVAFVRWRECPGYTNLYVASDYRYDKATGEIIADEDVLRLRNENDRFFVEEASQSGLVLRIEYGQALSGSVGGNRQTFRVGEFPSQDTYKVFGSVEEAMAYMNQVIASYE